MVKSARAVVSAEIDDTAAVAMEEASLKEARPPCKTLKKGTRCCTI